jgi:hypothetical protein
MAWGEVLVTEGISRVIWWRGNWEEIGHVRGTSPGSTTGNVIEDKQQQIYKTEIKPK